MTDACDGPVVLVVEDEALIRMCAVDLVENAGFRVVEASNADEAVEIINRGQDIDIIFTDVDMPGSMDGLELVRQLHESQPEVGIIVASGRRMPSRGELPTLARFFPKPYDEARISDALQELATNKKESKK